MTTKNSGSASQGVATKTETVEKSTATVQPGGALKEEKAPVSKTKVLSVEDRKTRSELFNTLIQKHETLKDVQKRVENFVIGSDEHSQSIQLKDGKGNTFHTGRPELIKPVIEMIRSHIAQQMGMVETEILDFVI